PAKQTQIYKPGTSRKTLKLELIKQKRTKRLKEGTPEADPSEAGSSRPTQKTKKCFEDRVCTYKLGQKSDVVVLSMGLTISKLNFLQEHEFFSVVQEHIEEKNTGDTHVVEEHAVEEPASSRLQQTTEDHKTITITCSVITLFQCNLSERYRAYFINPCQRFMISLSIFNFKYNCLLHKLILALKTSIFALNEYHNLYMQQIIGVAVSDISPEFVVNNRMLVTFPSPVNWQMLTEVAHEAHFRKFFNKTQLQILQMYYFGNGGSPSLPRHPFLAALKKKTDGKVSQTSRNTRQRKVIKKPIDLQKELEPKREAQEEEASNVLALDAAQVTLAIAAKLNPLAEEELASLEDEGENNELLSGDKSKQQIKRLTTAVKKLLYMRLNESIQAKNLSDTVVHLNEREVQVCLQTYEFIYPYTTQRNEMHTVSYVILFFLMAYDIFKCTDYTKYVVTLILTPRVSAANSLKLDAPALFH
ncbi:MAG: hypothetical protein EXX96DRAFT_640423, partial [Benjaminiella poitrasii]